MLILVHNRADRGHTNQHALVHRVFRFEKVHAIQWYPGGVLQVIVFGFGGCEATVQPMVLRYAVFHFAGLPSD